jgi:hypothetical protein
MLCFHHDESREEPFSPMKNNVQKVMVFFGLVLLGAITAIVLLSATEYWLVARTRDSGVFMYIGSEILEGRIPYRDIWDHKPPLIFYINALGILINPEHWWGVWWMQFAFLYSTLLTAFVLIRRQLEMIPAVASCAAFIVLFQPLYEQGNFTEQYAQLFQFAALYLFVALKQQPKQWHGYAVGMAGALAFLLRQNLIGVWVAIGLYLIGEAIFTRKWRENLRLLGRMVIGGIVPLLLVGVYFALHGALDEMLDAVFAYNFAHVASGQGTTESIDVSRMWLHGFRNITLGESRFPPFSLMPVAFIMALLYVRRADGQTRPIILISLLLLPIEVILANLSGYNFTHYFLTWLPVFTLLVAIAVYIVIQLLAAISDRYGWNKSRHFAKVKAFAVIGIQGILFAMLLVFLYPIIGIYLEQKREYPNNYIHEVPNFAVEYVRRYTEPDDTILVWGAQTEIYDLTERPAPSRFVYQYPLTKLGYDVERVTREFYADLLAHPPELIIDTRNRALPPLDAELVPRWQTRPGHGWHDGLQDIIDFVEANYVLESDEANGWFIYRLQDADSE